MTLMIASLIGHEAVVRPSLRSLLPDGCDRVLRARAQHRHGIRRGYGDRARAPHVAVHQRSAAASRASGLGPRSLQEGDALIQPPCQILVRIVAEPEPQVSPGATPAPPALD